MKMPRVSAEWRQGWPVVLSGLLGYGCGSSFFLIASSLFIAPMQADLGWSIKALTIMPIVVFLLAVCNPIAGILIDRWGARPIVIIGMILYAVGTIGIAVAPMTPLFFYAMAAFVGITAPLTSVSPIAKGVAGWFPTSSGTAFGLTMSGVSFISLIGMPMIAYAIQSYGWRSGYFVFAGLALLIGLPAVIWKFHERVEARAASTDAHQVLPGMHWHDALKDMRFWALFIAFFLASLALGGFLGHLQPILALKHFPVSVATFLGMVYAVSVLIGRLAGGILLDCLWDGLVAFSLLVLPGLSALVLIGVDIETPMFFMICIVLFIGLGQGAEGDFVAFFCLKIFGLRSYSTLVGLFMLSVGLGLAVGGLGFAAIVDETGSYSIAMRLSSACFMIAGLIFVALRWNARNGLVRARLR